MKRNYTSPQDKLSEKFKEDREKKSMLESQRMAEIEYNRVVRECDLLQIRLDEAENENARLRKLIYRVD